MANNVFYAGFLAYLGHSYKDITPKNKMIVERAIHVANREGADVCKQIAEDPLVQGIQYTVNPQTNIKGLINMGDKPIPEGTRVGWYSGILDPDSSSPYSLHIGMRKLKGRPWDICMDGIDTHSELGDPRFNANHLNHSCKNPNVHYINVNTSGGLPITIIVASKDIQPKEELLWNYGKKYWMSKAQTAKYLRMNPNGEEKLTRCLCRAPEACPLGRSQVKQEPAGRGKPVYVVPAVRLFLRTKPK